MKNVGEKAKVKSGSRSESKLKSRKYGKIFSEVTK